MAPTTPSGPSSSGLPKAPPTGPRALRGVNGSSPSTGPFQRSEKISIAIPSRPQAGPSHTPHLPSRPAPYSPGLNGGFGRKIPPAGPRAQTQAQAQAHSLYANGFASSSSPAESSRHASALSRVRADEGVRPPSPNFSRPPSPPSLPSTRPRSPSRSRYEKERYDPERSPSPVKRNKSPRKGDRSPTLPGRLEEAPYKAQFIKDERAPISFSLPLTGVVNGSKRSAPLYDNNATTSTSLGFSGHPDKAKDLDNRPPPPPQDRPPSPPPLPTDPAPPSPPPPDDRPPPPSPPPVRKAWPPPPPPTSSPPPVPNPPETSSRPTTIPNSLANAPAPPAFHFRDLSLRRRIPSDEDSSEESSESGEKESERLGPESAGPSSRRESRQPSPQPPPSPPKQPYIPPPIMTPACVERRPGLGNFVILTDGGKNYKEIGKRFDGVTEDGREVEVSDPRMANDDWKRGRGTAKQRTTFYRLEYEWDENSTGPKPPPPPPAVLITGLNPLTTVDQISKHVRPFGRVREIDSKMDLRSGMQLGICWVKFDGPPSGRPGTAHDVAAQVVKVCDGQRIGLAGNERIRVVLDGRGLRAEKAVKEEMARRYPPKKPAPPPPPAPTAPRSVAPTPASGGATPQVDKSDTKPPTSAAVRVPIVKPLHASLPTRPRPPINFDQAGKNYASLGRSLPVRPIPNSVPTRPAFLAGGRPATQHLASSFTDAPFAHKPSASRTFNDLRDSYSPRHSRSRSRSRSFSHPRSCSTCSSYYSSDSDDDRRPYRHRSPSPYTRGKGARARAPVVPDRSKEDEDAVARVKKVLADNGHSYVFIDTTALPAKSVSEEHLKDHFRAFKPIQVLGTFQGWHILFNDDVSATKAKILDSTIVQGHRLVINVKTPSTVRKPDESTGPEVNGETKGTGSWRFLTITKKNRAAAPAPKKSPVTILKKARRKPAFSSSDESSDDETPVRQSKRSSPVLQSESDRSEDEKALPPVKSAALPETPKSDDEYSSAAIRIDEPMPLVKDVEEDEPVIKAGKKRVAKGKTQKAGKKARITSPVIDIAPPVAPQVTEIKLDQDITEPIAKKAKVVKPKKAVQSELDKFLATGVVQDEEDAYWLGQALAAAHENIDPDLSDLDLEQGEEDDRPIIEGHILHHDSGSWRAEGWKKIPQIAKAEYLPQRNKAAVSTEDATALTSGRTARVTGRRLAHDMETTRKTAAAATAESDMFAFNQLRIRKKQLRFSRSPIEGYGLYAMETIHPGEMVCEYVGEICRSAVAEVREQTYLKQGIGSSYLFRIDSDMVCDATFKGSVSRLINHSCDPSASAKIISINGQSKIVIYAKRTLHPGQEILYDYKFPLESDPSLRVPCLCGAAVCRGWLN